MFSTVNKSAFTYLSPLQPNNWSNEQEGAKKGLNKQNVTKTYKQSLNFNVPALKIEDKKYMYFFSNDQATHDGK